MIVAEFLFKFNFLYVVKVKSSIELNCIKIFLSNILNKNSVGGHV